MLRFPTTRFGLKGPAQTARPWSYGEMLLFVATISAGLWAAVTLCARYL